MRREQFLVFIEGDFNRQPFLASTREVASRPGVGAPATAARLVAIFADDRAVSGAPPRDDLLAAGGAQAFFIGRRGERKRRRGRAWKQGKLAAIAFAGHLHRLNCGWKMSVRRLATMISVAC